MDSCNSSPSHSFKDRPRSRHGDLSRQPSFPHSLERAKSPAGKGASESRDAIAASRDLARRSYGDGSAEKDGGDGLLSSPERSRSSFRRPSGYERVERQRDSKAEMHRSARSCTPSRNPDRESGETGGRLAKKRSSHGELADRHEIAERVSSTPLQSERESSGCKGAPRKGFDRDGGDMKWRGSASPEFDREPSKSPVSGKATMRSDSKEAFKGSPRRPSITSGSQSSRKDLALEKGYTGSSPGKDVFERGKFSPPNKACGREPHDDMDATFPKAKPCKFRDLEKLKEQEVSSNETETRSWNKSFFSRLRSGGDDTIEGEHSHDAKSLHEEACRERSPMSFLHISKKARSERDRGRRDEHASKSLGRYSQWNEFVKVDTRKGSPADRSEYDSFVKNSIEGDKDSDAVHEAKDNEETSARSVDNGVVHAKERSFENVEKESRPPNDGDNSDMEEGELEPESHTVKSPEENNANAKEGEEIEKESCSVPIKTSKGKEVCKVRQLKVDVGEEDKLMDNGDEICRSRDDNSKNGEEGEKLLPPSDKEETQGAPMEADMVNMQFKAKNRQASTSKALELGESSRSGVLFDLLGAKTEQKSWNVRLSADKTIESSKELTLSLFTNPNDTVEESSHSKGDTHPKGSNGKQIEKLEVGAGEETSQLSGHKQKKLKMESLQLSLALPGSSNMGGHGPSHSAGPVEPARSFQSLNQTQTQTQNFLQSQTYTNSDGFTSSFSFSQSESFIHNPSCSLNCTSLENQELSCGGTRQLSQGTEQMSNRSWPTLSGNEQGMHTVTSVSHDKSKHRRGIPLHQRALQNGSMHQGFPSVTGSNRSSGSNHFSQRSHHYGQRLQEAPKILDSSSQDLDGSVRQVTTHKDIMERVRQQKAWFASKQQAMSAEARPARPEPSSAAQDRDKPVDPPAANVKGTTSTGKDIAVGERNVLIDKIGLHEITTDPIAVMAQKLQELPDSFLEGLKGVAKGVLGSFEKRDEFIALQENIRRRTDLTEDSLVRAHRTQLEILVALKTGIQGFVQEGSKPQTYTALIEIFLQTRCPNMECRQPLLVCGFDCRVCSKKSGFCHGCMCVVCSKFDSDNSTCSWLGCDICLHWCHTDCGLRMSYIAPTPTVQSTSGNTEMQYHCVACEHKSELYGFVKDVFRNCAETWGAETLAKELDCVRKIFHGSEDMRGKQLCWKAEQMLQKLENKVDAAEVCRSMLRFFQEGNAELDGASGPIKRSSSMKANDASGRMAEPARESVPKATSSGGSKLLDTDKARAGLPKFDRNVEEKRTDAAELQYERARTRAEIEDFERAVKLKQAEAKMFQMRADEAQQDAGALQRIISVKREKIDEDYACKYAKLRLSEAEERHQKRFEELKALENAQEDFQKMKIRMEGEIKELMMKMEMAKRQFTS